MSRTKKVLYGIELIIGIVVIVSGIILTMITNNITYLWVVIFINLFLSAINAMEYITS